MDNRRTNDIRQSLKLLDQQRELNAGVAKERFKALIAAELKNPATDAELEAMNDYVFAVGKYRGKTAGEIWAEDNQYFHWFFKQKGKDYSNTPDRLYVLYRKWVQEMSRLRSVNY